MSFLLWGHSPLPTLCMTSPGTEVHIVSVHVRWAPESGRFTHTFRTFFYPSRIVKTCAELGSDFHSPYQEEIFTLSSVREQKQKEYVISVMYMSCCLTSITFDMIVLSAGATKLYLFLDTRRAFTKPRTRSGFSWNRYLFIFSCYFLTSF